MGDIHTEECYVASIDLLGAKGLIINDTDDVFLNQIKNIYTSWLRIKQDWDFSRLSIKIFSDNVVIAIRSEYSDSADNLLEFVAYMAEHFLYCGYKPRGGICKGKLYIDDIFVWGKGLVSAYWLESKTAIYPRIILDLDVVAAASKHLSEWMIFEDDDGRYCLNYLKSFGGNKQGWIEKIGNISEWVYKELEDLHAAYELEEDQSQKQETKKIIDKIQWLKKYVDNNMSFWSDYKK